MKRMISFTPVVLLLAGVAFAQSPRQEPFSTLTGPVKVGDVKKSNVYEIPFITWGGDVATFVANGGLDTKSNSIFGKMGIRAKLVPGDNFVDQVKRYVAGDSPFLRGELRMLGLASEVIGSDPRTKPVVFLQLTWSLGDHMVAREGLKNLNELKGKKIVLQRAGPHVGLLADILATARLTWQDVTVVWADELTGSPKSPAEMFRADKSLDACFVISPDMVGLTGGIDQVPKADVEGTIKGSHVLVSTATLSRSLADVYAVRKDFYDANRDYVEKFTAGYIKASDDLIAGRKAYEAKDASPAKSTYASVLKLTQTIYGEKVIPQPDPDAAGLLQDCVLVSLPGNIAYFKEKGNKVGFEEMQRETLSLAVSQGYAKSEYGFLAADWDYKNIAKIAGVEYREPDRTKRRVAEGTDVFVGEESNDNGLYSFTIGFKTNQSDFSAIAYGGEFESVINMLRKSGNAVIQVKGHSDPTQTLLDLIAAGKANGSLKVTGVKGKREYFLNGAALDLQGTKELVRLIGEGKFDGSDTNPRETMAAAKTLSSVRADAVKSAIIEYAKTKNYVFDPSQIQTLGVGIAEPVIATPRSPADAEKNMRVEFVLRPIKAEGAANYDDY